MRQIQTLRPGTRFRLHGMPEVTGVLMKVNECRAVVRLDRPERQVEFEDADGETRRFRSRGSQMTSWAPATPVEPIGFQTLKENEMSTTTKKTKKAPKSESKAAKPAKPKASQPD